MASTAPSTHPMSACGPPIAEIMSGIVMKGPMPTICDMLIVVAGKRPKALTKPSSLPCAVVSPASDLPDVAISYLLPYLPGRILVHSPVWNKHRNTREPYSPVRGAQGPKGRGLPVASSAATILAQARSSPDKELASIGVNRRVANVTMNDEEPTYLVGESPSAESYSLLARPLSQRHDLFQCRVAVF